MSGRFYLDHNASSPMCPEAVEAVARACASASGNPSSIHAEGRAARATVDLARDRVAAALGAQPHEIVFTSGGTESCNLGVIGLALARGDGKTHIACSAVEHHAVLHACRWLAERMAFTFSLLPVDASGVVRLEDLPASVNGETALVSVMVANNETGTLQPVAEIAAFCRARGILFHTDASQAAGKIRVSPGEIGCDALSLSAHKFAGPPGAGALFLRAGVPIVPLSCGGEQESMRRAGTENAPALAGMAAALDAAMQRGDGEGARQFALVEALWEALSARHPRLVRNGHATARVPNTLNCSLPGASSEELLIACDLEGLSLSSGAACMVGTSLPSHVLGAMGLPPEVARSAIRFSVGPNILIADVPEIAERFVRAASRCVVS